MSLYDLNKDMLVYLISTIRSETIKELNSNTISFTPSEAERLCHTICRNFYNEQEDRFSVINNEYDPNSISDDGTMFLCGRIVDAVFLKNFLVKGGKRCVIVDDDSDYIDEGSYVVLCDYSWEEYQKNGLVG